MTLSLAALQSNFTVGDITGNIARITEGYHKAAAAKADIVVFCEMAITGYPPEDLVLRRRFQRVAMKAVDKLAALTQNGPAMLVGGLWCEGDKLYNAAFLLEGGKVIHTQYKRNLPNYGVFDEIRLFTPGALPKPVEWRGLRIGILICEDLWSPELAGHLKGQGADLLIAINASPYEMGKASQRGTVAKARVMETGLPLLYINQVGGQDELVFDGRSFAFARSGLLAAQLKPFEEDIALLQVHHRAGGWDIVQGTLQTPLSDEETIYRAMVLGLRDYVNKNRFPGVVLGLSGGIDSALCSVIAADALGADRVRAIMMPSPYTSRESLEDAAEGAKRLGIRLDTVPIAPGMEAFNVMLAPLFAGRAADTTEENIQSRLRGNILMAVSNKEGLMVLTTGNKSEMSVGYATLYGDMCGGYGVLKNLYKTTVYRVAAWCNRECEVIPARILTKAPSAELKPDQTDQDTLPPYEILDAILLRLVEQQLSVDDIVAEGYDRNTVERVSRMLYAAEYKRRQSPPGVKITGMSFGRDRRYPITSGWRG
jgi:NAD+ synthase